MIQKLTFSFLAFLFYLTSSAQTLNWGFPTANSGQNLLVEPSSSAQFSNGDILVAGQFMGTLQLKGSTPSYTASPTSIRTGFFSRIDTNGTLLWTKILNGHEVYISDIEIGANDSIYVTGSFHDSIDLDPSSNSSIIQPPIISPQVSTTYPFLSKYDANGNFTKGSYIRFKSNKFAGLEVKPQIKIGSNSRLIFAFCPSPYGFVDVDLSTDSIWVDASSHAFQPLYIINYDLNFNYKWHKTIHGAYTSPIELCGLAVNSSNDIILTVFSANSIEADPNQTGPEYTNGSALISLSQTGSFKWINGIGEGIRQNLNAILGSSKTLITDPLTDAIFVYAQAPQAFDLDRSSGIYSIPLGHYIAKFDKNGHIFWAHNLASSSIILPSMTMQDENFIIGGSFTGSIDFDFGVGDSTLTSPNGNPRAYIARYDGDGQFLSVFTLTSSSTSFVSHIATNPISKSIIAFLAGSVGTIDLDPSLTTQNVNIPTASGLAAIASYKLPCISAKALDRDTLPDHYEYCSNEPVDITFPRHASGYSQTVWQMDTGNGFSAIDTSFIKYQIVSDNIRLLPKGGIDTTYIRGIITNSCGADTTEIVSFFIRPANIDTLNYFLCKNDSVIISGNKYYSPIMFNDSLQNNLGCDSIIVYNIHQDWPSALPYDNNGTLICTGGYDTYQWIYCSNMQPVIGATDSVFIPSDSGQYAVIVSINGCSDTSKCMRSSISILEQLKVDIDMFPNPASKSITIQITNANNNLNGHIRNLSGQHIKSFSINSNSINIDLSQCSSGLYFMEIWDNEKNLVFKEKLMLLD